MVVAAIGVVKMCARASNDSERRIYDACNVLTCRAASPKANDAAYVLQASCNQLQRANPPEVPCALIMKSCKFASTFQLKRAQPAVAVKVCRYGHVDQTLEQYSAPEAPE